MKNTRNTDEYAFSLIIDEMNGVLTGEKWLELKRWINSDPENKKIYTEFNAIARRVELLSEYGILDFSTPLRETPVKREPALRRLEHWVLKNTAATWIMLVVTILILVFGLYVFAGLVADDTSAQSLRSAIPSTF